MNTTQTLTAGRGHVRRNGKSWAVCAPKVVASGYATREAATSALRGLRAQGVVR